MARLFVANLQRPCLSCASNSSAFDTRVSVSCADEWVLRRISTQGHFLLTLLLLMSPGLFAQTTSGIFGTVTDQQGLPIVGAEVVTRGDATGSGTTSISDSEG